jgi:aminoglycoside 6'-N-acetyltransferase
MRADPEFKPLVTERLVLRRSRPEDAEPISAYRSDPNVNRYQGWDRTDPEGIRAEIVEMESRAQFTVEERDGGRVVGDVGISAVDGEPSVAKIGYTIAPAFQGRGYATEAVRALVDYAFETLGAERVRAFAAGENVPSLRVAENVGLRLVERYEHRHGGQVVRYELARDER